MRPGAGGEDVQDQLRAVQDLDPLAALAAGLLVDDLFQAADLARGEVVVEDDDVGVLLLGQVGDLHRLAAADVGAGVGAVAALEDRADDRRPGRLGQRAQLAQRFARVGRRTRQDHPHEHGPLLADRQFRSLQFSQSYVSS